MDGQHRPDIGRQATRTLKRALRRSVGADAFRSDGRLKDWQSGLLPRLRANGRVFPNGIDAAPLSRAESGAFVALNSFLPWVDRADGLHLGEVSGFEHLRFHARCPAGARGTPPRLDLIAWRTDEVVAVTAKGFDYLKPRGSRPKLALNGEIPGLAPWLQLLQAPVNGFDDYHHLDIVGLVKLAVGVGTTFPRQRIALLYLFWEDDDAAEPFVRHRAELARLVETVADSKVRLMFLSFEELWQGWLDRGRDDRWLNALVGELRAHYTVAKTPAVAL